MLLLSFPLCDSDLHTFIDASTSSITFDEDNGLHILDIQFALLNLHTIAPIQTSESFHCFLSAPASHSSPRQTHNLNIVQSARSTTTQDKTRQDVYAN